VKTKRPWAITALLGAALLGVLLIAMGAGSVYIPPGEVARILTDPSQEGSFATIIRQIRLPRVILAALVGSCLATAGAVFQGLFKNPMADPYVIGVSSGASLGAVVAMALGLQLRFLGLDSVPILAFLGAVATMLLVYNLARTGGKVPVLTLLVAGVAVGSFLSALVSLFVYFADERLHQVVFWLMGGFAGATWHYVGMALPYTVIGLAMVGLHARELNVLLLGEEQAQHLGVDVERVKRILLAAGSLLTATAVSTAGPIGFVGLIAPHMVRMIIGPDHRSLLPAVALLGAVFLVAADTLARTIISPTELPVGLITALCGGPFFIYLLRRRGLSP
jgi:iron complex transport system permease protein